MKQASPRRQIHGLLRGCGGPGTQFCPGNRRLGNHLRDQLVERRWDILNTPGIYDLLSSGGRPIVIPTSEINAIQQVVNSGFRLEPHPFLKIGERVKIKRGPLAGLQGLLVRQRNIYRLVLSVEMLGRAAAVEVDSFLVERLTNSSVVQHGVSAHIATQ